MVHKKYCLNLCEGVCSAILLGLLGCGGEKPPENGSTGAAGTGLASSTAAASGNDGDSVGGTQSSSTAGATGNATDTTGDSHNTGTTSDAQSSGTTDATGNTESETHWPPPDPNNQITPCPDGYALASLVGGGVICSPPCSGPNHICPSGDTGNAKGLCAFNPDSSTKICKVGDLCADENETCEMVGGGAMACLKPSDHCILLCTKGETCPAGMVCSGNIVCQYPS